MDPAVGPFPSTARLGLVQRIYTKIAKRPKDVFPLGDLCVLRVKIPVSDK